MVFSCVSISFSSLFDLEFSFAKYASVARVIAEDGDKFLGIEL